jgi:hypothetical protein
VLQQWLLNLALDFPVPLRLLPPLLNGDDRQGHALNVRSFRGVMLETVIAELVKLSENGLVAFMCDGGFDRVAPAEVVSRMNAPEVWRDISFELTEAGGRAWETSAQPRWRDMDYGSAVSCKDGDLEGWNWTWFSQSRERLMAVLGWFPVLENGRIDLGRIAWKLHAEYPVRYWKRLPDVHVVTFRSGSTGESLPASSPRETELEWFTTWRIARSNWYRHPWEMPGWP